jgi:hypothetical protein
MKCTAAEMQGFLDFYGAMQTLEGADMDALFGSLDGRGAVVAKKAS